MLELVILWTDVALYALVACLLSYIVYVLRHRQSKVTWQRILRRPLAFSALVIILVYLLVALADSVHWRNQSDSAGVNGPVVSALDKWIAPIGMQHEKTYSAPMAFHAYVKESSLSAEGRYRQQAPRLQIHQGLVDRHAYDTLIKTRTMWAVLYSIIASVLLCALLWPWRQRAWPYKTACCTLLCLATLICFIYQFAQVGYVLGTDKIGQDVLYQAIKGIRTGLLIGTLTTLVMLPFAVGLGMCAGYFKGWVDDVIQFSYTTLSSVPGVLLIAASILAMQITLHAHPDLFSTNMQRADARLLILCIILGVASWTGLCRLLRAETFKLASMDYIKAAKVAGVGDLTVLGRHILPNLGHIILITVTLDFSGLVLAEAVLSYVGVGVHPLTYSWGNMINLARLEMAREPIVWWPLSAAFLFMFCLVLAANLFADAVRDGFDPRETA